jgi:hypothetical protein
MPDRTAVPTAEQRKDIGRKAAISLGLTVADLASRSNVRDGDGLYDLITTQASTRTWDAILSASWEDVASAGIPGTVLDAGVRKGFSRETVGRLVQEAAQQVFEDADKVAEMTQQVIESQPEVATLVEENRRLSEANSTLMRWQRQAQSDMSLASERLIEESERRNWCSEYDQIIDDINSRMNVLAFDVREQEVDCEAEVEAEVTVELNGYQLSGTITMNISYTGSPTEDPSDADYITDGTVEQYAAEALGVSYRYVSVDSWSVESYEAS